MLDNLCFIQESTIFHTTMGFFYILLFFWYISNILKFTFFGNFIIFAILFDDRTFECYAENTIQHITINEKKEFFLQHYFHWFHSIASTHVSESLFPIIIWKLFICYKTTTKNKILRILSFEFSYFLMKSFNIFPNCFFIFFPFFWVRLAKWFWFLNKQINKIKKILFYVENIKIINILCDGHYKLVWEMMS